MVRKRKKKKKKKKKNDSLILHSFDSELQHIQHSVTKWMKDIIEIENAKLMWNMKPKNGETEEEEEEIKKPHPNRAFLMRMKQKQNTIKWHIHHNLFLNHLTTNKFSYFVYCWRCRWFCFFFFFFISSLNVLYFAWAAWYWTWAWLI